MKVNMFSKLSAQYQSVFDKLGLQIKQIIDEIEENIDAEKESFRLWAFYGWTTIGWATIGFYRTPPLSHEDADRRSLEFFPRPDSIRSYFSKEDKKFLRYSDLEEALRNFDAKNYKSCTMLLVSMIDRQLLHYQKLENRNEIKVGRRALKIIDNHIETKDPFMMLVHWNTFCFLKYLFDYDGTYKNFQNEPNIINRNFLMHGMSNRIVIRTDCIKLFVALKNVSTLIFGNNKTYEEENV